MVADPIRRVCSRLYENSVLFALFRANHHRFFLLRARYNRAFLFDTLSVYLSDHSFKQNLYFGFFL